MENSRYRLLIFDMDGTFLNSSGFHERSLHRFVNECYRPASAREVTGAMGANIQVLLENLGARGAQLPELLYRLDCFYERNAAEFLPQLQIHPGIYPALQKARQCGYRTVLFSNSMDHLVQLVLRANGLDGLFDFASGSVWGRMDKMVRCRAYLDAADLQPEAYVCIGDAEHDMKMARSFGCACCFCDTPFSWYRSRTALLRDWKPDYIVSDLAQLPDVFEA